MGETITTPLTKLLGIRHPVVLAGMNVAAGPRLAAAVTNAGGLGVIGGVGYTPSMLKKNIDEIKANLKDKNAPFGVDLLLPQVGGSARKTNHDYTKGKLPQLIDIVIQEKAKLFVSAVGVPPRWAVEKLHAAGILVMNMVGAPKHVLKALAAGVDIICAQGGEGGGHTGSIPTSLLVPACVDLCKNAKSPLTGGPVYVMGAGGIYDGRGLASVLSYGAQAAWVGTRFVAATEAGAPPMHKKAVVNASYSDTMRTIIYTGRPLRIVKNWYAEDFETNRADEIKELAAKGTIPYLKDLNSDLVKERMKNATRKDRMRFMKARPLLSGQVAGAITSVMPAKEIIDEMVSSAIKVFRERTAQINRSRL